MALNLSSTAADYGIPDDEEERPSSIYDSPASMQRMRVPRPMIDYDASDRLPPGFAANNRRRAINAADQQARITDQKDIEQRRRDRLQSAYDRNPATAGRIVRPNTSIGQVRLDAQREELMNRTPADRQAKIRETHAEMASQPRSPYQRPGIVRRIHSAQRRVASDPASQAGTGSPRDPYRKLPVAERAQEIASTMKSGDSIGIREDRAAAVGRPNDMGGAEVHSMVSDRPLARPRPGQVQNPAGEWVPIADETARISRATGSSAAFPAPRAMTSADRVRSRVQTLEGTGGPQTRMPDGSPITSMEQYRAAESAALAAARLPSDPYRRPVSPQ